MCGGGGGSTGVAGESNSGGVPVENGENKRDIPCRYSYGDVS